MTTRYARSVTTLWRSVGSETLLTASSRHEVDSLSDSATAVWGLLARPCTLDEVVRRLSERYGTSRDTVERDVRALLDQLVARGWVEVR